ncbi:unnamed protein product, partial [Rotaria sp. Silwood2]
FSNQIQQQRLSHRQSLPSSQYSQAINNTYSSNSRVTTNNSFVSILVPSNDRWINLLWTDPAIILLDNKLDTTPPPNGNNLMANSRWPQQQQQQQSQTHMLTNGICHMPYSITSGVDDGNHS